MIEIITLILLIYVLYDAIMQKEKILREKILREKIPHTWNYTKDTTSHKSDAKPVHVEEKPLLLKIDTIGDGSCLFHAFMQLTVPSYTIMTKEKKSESVMTIRETLANNLDYIYPLLHNGNIKSLDVEESSEISLSSFKTMLRKNGRDGSSPQWADIYMVEALSRMTCYNIVLIDSNTKEIYTKCGSFRIDYSLPTIFIEYEVNCHFSSMETLQGGEYYKSVNESQTKNFLSKLNH